MNATRISTHYPVSRAVRIALAALTLPAAALAQDAAEPLDELEDIIITGSRIARSSDTQGAPLATLSSDDFLLAGTANVEDLLNSMPQLVPGLTAASGSITEGDGTATADLRGLGAQRTLVLVNGRRWLFSYAQQLADLNTIPQALVKRVEVVTGGSSAVYGSDAIAGVVNFVLDDEFSGFKVSAKHGETFRNDGRELDVNLAAGGSFADGRGHAVFSVNYLERGSVRGRDRSFAARSYREVIDENGQARFEASGDAATVPEGRFSGLPTGAALNNFPALQAALADAGLANAGALGFIVDNGVPRPFISPDDNFDNAAYSNIVIPQKRWSLTQFGHFNLTDNVQAYAEGAYSNNVVNIPIAPALLNQNTVIRTDNPFITPELRNVLVELDAIDDQRGTAPGIANDGLVTLAIARRMLETGERSSTHERNGYKVTGGLRGVLGNASERFLRDLSFDANYTYARTTSSLLRHGVLSRSRFDQGVLVTADGSACLDTSGGCVPVNPFGANAVSDEAVKFLSVDGAGGDTVSTLHVAGLNLSGTLLDLPAGPLGVAFGVETRKAAAEFIPDEYTATGDVAGYSAAAPASAGSSKVREAYAEFRAPLVAGRRFAEKVTLGGAVRLSDYDLDGVDSVWTYFGGLEWKLDGNVALRGQYQRAIRAPSLIELYAPVSIGITPYLDPCAAAQAATDPDLRAICIAAGVPTDVVGTPAVQTNATVNTGIGGNPNLDAEVADTITLGATLTPSAIPGLRFSLDYFDIKLKDAIGALAGGPANILDLCYNVLQDLDSEPCRAIIRNPITGSVGGTGVPGINATNVNISRVRTSGLDLGLAYNLNLGWGLIGDSSKLSFNFDGTWLRRYDVTPVPDMPELVNECAGTFGTICGQPRPKFKSTSRVNWKQGPLSLSARWRLIGSVDDDRVAISGLAPERSAAPVLGTEHYFDLSAAWDVNSNYDVVVGVNNVLDNKPPRSVNFGASGYNTYDALGARYFATFTARF